MIGKRIAIGMATLGMIFCILGGSVISVRLARAHSTAVYWSLLPFVLSMDVFIQILRDGDVATIWLPLGGLVGFVISALFSLGAGFALGSIVLVISATTHLLSSSPVRAWLSLALFLVGGSGVTVIFLVSDWVRSIAFGIEVTHAPVVVAGSWVFIVMLGLMWTIFWIRSARGERV